MACILWDVGNKLAVGRDFCDAATGTVAARGEVQVGRTRYEWKSTMSCANTERVLRAAAAKEGMQVSYLLSQAL